MLPSWEHITPQTQHMSHRVLMFGWEYPPSHHGGLGVACHGLVQGLKHHGATITLVLPHKEAQEEGVDIRSPSTHTLTYSTLHAYDTFTSVTTQSGTTAIDSVLYGNNLGATIHSYTQAAVELTKDTNPDVVHSHDWMTFAAGKRAANYHGVPFIAHIHATELDRTHFKPHQWIAQQERIGILSADHVITVSNYTKTMLIEEYGIPAEKISVVHNAGPAPLHHPLTTHHTTHPLVLFLGRLTVQKGPFHFLEAARIVITHNPHARFVIAGEGYLLPELIERACAMGIEDKIIFAGKVHSHEAQQLFAKAHCFVMPSTSEPFGLVALEAAAQGTPVILSKQSGVREVMPHSMSIDFWDIEKLADCILTVLREEPLAQQLRSEARAALKPLTWQHQATQVLSIYNSARTVV